MYMTLEHNKTALSNYLQARFATLSLRSASVSGTMNKLSENLSCGKLQDFFACMSYARNISFVHSYCVIDVEYCKCV
jgi:hypothetical protein